MKPGWTKVGSEEYQQIYRKGKLWGYVLKPYTGRFDTFGREYAMVIEMKYGVTSFVPYSEEC